MDAKKVLMVLAVLLIATIATAAVVTYLSNSVSASVAVSSPIQLSAIALNGDGEEVDLAAITAYGGETITVNTVTENLSNVAQACDLTMTATPAIETTEGELTTKIIKTVSLEALAEEANTTTITFASDIEPGNYALSLVCNIVAEEE